MNGESHRAALTQQHIDQMSQILGVMPMTDPELLSMNERGLRERYDHLSAHYVRCGRKAPEYEEWHELAKDVFSSKGLAALHGGGTRVVAFLRKVQGHVLPDGSEEVTIISVPDETPDVRRVKQTEAVTKPETITTTATGGVTINIHPQKEG